VSDHVTKRRVEVSLTRPSHNARKLLLISPTYPRRDGQAEFIWVIGYIQTVTHPNTKPGPTLSNSVDRDQGVVIKPNRHLLWRHRSLKTTMSILPNWRIQQWWRHSIEKLPPVTINIVSYDSL